MAKKKMGEILVDVGWLGVATCSSERAYLHSDSRGDSLSRTASRTLTMDRLIAIHLSLGWEGRSVGNP